VKIMGRKVVRNKKDETTHWVKTYTRKDGTVVKRHSSRNRAGKTQRLIGYINEMRKKKGLPPLNKYGNVIKEKTRSVKKRSVKPIFKVNKNKKHRNLVLEREMEEWR